MDQAATSTSICPLQRPTAAAHAIIEPVGEPQEHGGEATLLDLGRRAAALDSRMLDWPGDVETSAYTRLLKEHDEIVAQIIARPANTAAGLRVKAECLLRWVRDLGDDPPQDTDGALGVSLARDLARLL